MIALSQYLHNTDALESYLKESRPWDRGLVRALLELTSLTDAVLEQQALSLAVLYTASVKELSEAPVEELEQVCVCVHVYA